MLAPQTYEQSLKSMGVGYAIVAADDWRILFENALFFRWFPMETVEGEITGGETVEGETVAGENTGGGKLTDRMPKFDVAKALNRLDNGRKWMFETDVRIGARTSSLIVETRREQIDGTDYVVIECRDISKQKEAEYMLDSYSRMSEKHAREMRKEKERVEKLLLNIMPHSVYEELRDFGTTTPQRFDSASVLMLDFVGFTEMAIARDPSSIIAELNDIFSAFDRIVELFGCERIKTVGDCYIAVSGLPEANPDHAANIAKVALRMRRYLKRRNAAHPIQWECRIGLATGAVIGSLVGIQKYVYDIFGPAVNLSARLEAFAQPMQIVMCEEAEEAAGDAFVTDEIGSFEIKGFGERRLYTLEEEIRN